MGFFSALGRFFKGEVVAARATVVVEVGNDWIKLADSRPGLGGRRITRLACVPLPAGRPAAEAIAHLFQQYRLSKRNVITYLPRQQVTVRALRVPATDPSEVDRMVRLQAGRQTPYSREEVVTAHRTLSTDADGYSNVILAIARRSVVAGRLEDFRQAGIELQRIATSSEAMWCRYRGHLGAGASARRVAALLDVDAGSADFSVFQGDGLTFSRSILIGASQLHEDPDRWTAELLKEIDESINRYRTEHGDQAIEVLVLSGASAACQALEGELRDGLKLAVEVADPLVGVRLRRPTKALAAAGAANISFSPLLGAGTHADDLSIDLMLPEKQVRRVLEDKRRQLNVLGVLGLTVVTLISALIFISIYTRHTQLNAIEADLAADRPRAEYVEALEEQILLLRQRLDARGVPMVLLAEISTLTPDTIYITNLQISAKENVVLRGRAMTNNDVFTYVKALEVSPMLKDAKATFTAQKKDQDGDFTEFEIRGEFQQKPDAATEADAVDAGNGEASRPGDE